MNYEDYIKKWVRVDGTVCWLDKIDYDTGQLIGYVNLNYPYDAKNEHGEPIKVHSLKYTFNVNTIKNIEVINENNT